MKGYNRLVFLVRSWLSISDGKRSNEGLEDTLFNSPCPSFGSERPRAVADTEQSPSPTNSSRYWDCEKAVTWSTDYLVPPLFHGEQEWLLFKCLTPLNPWRFTGVPPLFHWELEWLPLKAWYHFTHGSLPMIPLENCRYGWHVNSVRRIFLLLQTFSPSCHNWPLPL